MADALAPTLPADTPSNGPGGQTAAGFQPPLDPAARLVPTPFGLEAHRGAVRLVPVVHDGHRYLRVELHGAVVECLFDADARDHLAWLCQSPIAGGGR